MEVARLSYWRLVEFDGIRAAALVISRWEFQRSAVRILKPRGTFAPLRELQLGRIS